VEETGSVPSFDKHMPPKQILTKSFVKSGVEGQSFHFGSSGIHSGDECPAWLDNLCAVLK